MITRLPLLHPLRVTLVLIATASLVACGGADESAPASAPTEAAEEAEELTATEAQERGILHARFPNDGTRIEDNDELLTVFARHVPRFGVLRKLAVRYRFEVVDWSGEDPLVDVYVENVALETALARLIEPTPYTVAYSHDSETDMNQVIQIVIGDAPIETRTEEDKQARRDSKDAEDKEREQERRYKPRSAQDAARRMAERAVRQERRKAEALEDILSDDPTVREDAVATGLDGFDPVENGLLTDLAIQDPDPRVRLEAVRQLGFGAVTLRAAPALEDPDPEIVEEALITFSYSHDPAVRDLILEKVNDPRTAVSEQALNSLADYDMENEN